MPITLYYHPLSPPIRSSRLLAKAIGVKLELKMLDTLKGEQLKTEFLAINPQHSIPTIVDGEFVLWESRAILGYLVDKYAKTDALYPKDPRKRAVVNQRLHFDCGTLYQRMGDYWGALLNGLEVPKEKLERLQEALGFLNNFLNGQEWVACNQKTIADYSIVVTVTNLEALGTDLKKYPNIVSWLARVKSEFVDFDEIVTTPVTQMMEFIRARPAPTKV